MPLTPATWTNANLELGWLRGGPKQGNWSDAYALIWHDQPIYCVGSVSVINREYHINTSGWHGMAADDKESLGAHLKSLHLTPSS